MNEIERIEDQLRRALEGQAWHGPALFELLDGVTAAQASAHPIAGAHSIWELVLHLGGTYGLVLRRLRGDGAQLSADQDWPAIPEPSAANWQAALDGLRQRNRELRAALATFPASRLDLPLVASVSYSAYVQLIGLTQHDLYHAGQIALLKRALAGPDSAG